MQRNKTNILWTFHGEMLVWRYQMRWLVTDVEIVDTEMRSKDRSSVGKKVDNTIHWINHYSVSNTISFPTTYPLDGDLSAG